jgi:hypothetical protein
MSTQLTDRQRALRKLARDLMRPDRAILEIYRQESSRRGRRRTGHAVIVR